MLLEQQVEKMGNWWYFYKYNLIILLSYKLYVISYKL